MNTITLEEFIKSFSINESIDIINAKNEAKRYLIASYVNNSNIFEDNFKVNKFFKETYLKEKDIDVFIKELLKKRVISVESYSNSEGELLISVDFKVNS